MFIFTWLNFLSDFDRRFLFCFWLRDLLLNFKLDDGCKYLCSIKDFKQRAAWRLSDTTQCWMFIWKQLSVSYGQVASLCILLYLSLMHPQYTLLFIMSHFIHISCVQLGTNIFNIEQSLGPDLICLYIQPLYSKHTHTVQCIRTGQNNIRFRDSEKDMFPAVKNMLSSAAHLSLNRIIKSWGGWRGEGGEGTLLRECGRMWETEGKMERRGEKQEYDDRAEGQVRNRKGQERGGLKQNPE